MRLLVTAGAALLVAAPQALANPATAKAQVAEASTTGEPLVRDEREVDIAAGPAIGPMEALMGRPQPSREFESLLPSRFSNRPPRVPESGKLEDLMPPEIRRRGCGACSSSPQPAGPWPVLGACAVLLLRRRAVRTRPKL